VDYMKGENYVDITKKSSVTCVEWFHGYGGNALGLKRAIPGLQSVAVCERDAFVVANMVSKMEKGLLDAVPIWTDVTDFPCEPFGYQQLDFFAASYPCQGFSHAGKRLGVEDHRHLWPYCRHFIQRVRPGWVWLENVEGHVSLGLSTVLADLEEDGYTAAWGIFSASEVGAPHQRKRVFILAQRIDTGLQRGPESVEGRAEYQRHDGDILRAGLESGSEDVAYDMRPGGEGEQNEAGRGDKGDAGVADDCCFERGEGVWPSRPGCAQHGWEPPRVVENPVQQRVQRGPGVARGNDGSGPDGETALSGGGREDRGADRGQTQPPLGGNADGPAAGLDFPRCTGLTDTELAEIREWMGKGTNRTDELRMCGNGVVPQTAERAFRVLYAELTN
jgi:DNA (cytosine-5)-methyltransferase 1